MGEATKELAREGPRGRARGVWWGGHVVETRSGTWLEFGGQRHVHGDVAAPHSFKCHDFWYIFGM